jgi:hypothetical protein
MLVLCWQEGYVRMGRIPSLPLLAQGLRKRRIPSGSGRTLYVTAQFDSAGQAVSGQRIRSPFRQLKSGQIRPTETGIAFIVLARLLLEVRDEVIDALIAIERGEVNLVRFGSTPLGR